MSCIIRNKINSGGFGDVYKVIIEKEEKTEAFALKVIQNNLYGIQCFVELMILLFCSHKYILNCFQYCVDFRDNVTKILMPLANSDLFKKICSKDMKYKLEKFRPKLKILFWQIVYAVSFLHSCGIIHGDIKPSNILMYKNEIRLADFSLSSFLFNNEKIYNSNCYTEKYRAPEIWANQGYSYKADIWALGCTFHELLYGKSYSIDFPKRFLEKEEDLELKNLLEKMLEIREENRWNIWDILNSEYFKENKRKEKFSFELSYPERITTTLEQFVLKLHSTVSPFCPEVPYYVYDIIGCKFFRQPIPKQYKAYLNETLVKYETNVLEVLHKENLGKVFINF
jgi:serine/threonine protein kinase